VPGADSDLRGLLLRWRLPFTQATCGRNPRIPTDNPSCGKRATRRCEAPGHRADRRQPFLYPITEEWCVIRSE
jgi:hypothetical protein